MSLLSTTTAANNFHAPEPYNRGDNMTPTTTRPSTAPSTHASHIARPDDATTPTRSTLGALASQKPLPSATAFPSAIPPIPKPETDKSAPLPQRHGSIVSVQSKRSHDVDMDDSDDGDDASDDGSVNPDGSKSNKKKKGQKFYCTDFPPCTLSFTRSEHLARHIRKHTGERPFQCHCSRRFSRLDNLRQHAQTVHVNEDIPQDSLAASGTRFQRQVRTERARPIGNRSRASTVGSQSSGGRGHHRNSLSASSIGSVMSNYSQRDDPRKRPAPLPLPSDPRSRLSLETYNMRPGSPSGQLYRPASPGGYHTPTSTTNSVGQNSPRWPGMQSPSSGHSRTQSLFNDNRTPGRRLSVPSGTSPFQAYPVPAYGPQLSPLNSSNSAVFPTLPSNAPNLGLSSPTSSIGSGSSWSRRDSVAASMVDGDPRRRTWHPDTQSNFTSSRLNVVTTPSHYQTPVYQYPPPPPPPAFTLPSQNTPPHATRLPGIESFDPLRPQTPPRRETSPMAVDTPSRMASHSMEGYRHDEQTLFQPPRWDRSLAQNLNGLEIAPGAGHPPDSARSWASEADRAVQGQAAERMSQQSVRFEQACHQPTHYANLHPQHVSAPPLTPRAAKRAGWYNGPLKTDRRAQRISPEHSSSPEGVPGTPQSSNVNDYHPSIVHASGWIETSHPGHHIQDPRTVQHMQMPAQVSSSAHYQPYSAPATDNYTYAHHDVQMAANENMHREGQSQMPKANNDLHRLETLVAVATGENTATRAY